MKTAIGALLSDLELEEATLREAVEEGEGGKWCLLLADLNFFFGREVQLEQIKKEREVISREEVLARNKLVMKADLMIHGFTPSAEDENNLLRTIHVEPPKSPDESWRALPQILPTVHLKQLKPMAELCSDLGIADPKILRALMQDEERGRNNLLTSQTQLRMRFERTFTLYLDGLKDMEANLVREVQQAFLAKLQPEQRIAYIMRPCIARETASRHLLQVVEQAERGGIALGIEEALVRGRLQRFIIETLKDRRDRKLAYALQVVDGKAKYRLRSYRYFAWKTHVAEKARVNKAIKLMLSVSLTQNLILLRRYCAIWNRPLHTRRCALQRQALFGEADLAFCQLVLREEEERERNFLLISWENSRGSMTDAFLSQRDALRMTLLRSRAVALREVSHATHLRSRMLTMYRYVVRKTQLQRAQWLGETNTLITIQRYFRKFRQFPVVGRQNAKNRRAAVATSLAAMEMLSITLLETYGRTIRTAEVDLWTRGMWQAHGEVVQAYCKELQGRAIEALRERCVKAHTKLRFSKWLRLTVDRSPNAAAAALCNTNALIHSGSAYSRWTRWLGSRKQLLLRAMYAAMHTRDATALEENEARHRLLLSQKEGWLRNIVARRGPRQATLRQSDTENLRLRSQLRTLARAYASWDALRHRRMVRRYQLATVATMRAATQQRLLRQYSYIWQEFRDRLKLQAAVASQIKECLESEGTIRGTLLLAENDARESCAQLLSRDEALVGFRRRQHLCDTLVAKSKMKLCRVRFGVWHRRTLRRMRKIELAPRLHAAGFATNLRYYFAKLAAWRRWCQGSRLTQGLLERVRKHLALKYFRRLYPAAVRQAKVCRARNALAQAQAAARLLDAAAAPQATLPAVGATGRNLPKSFLPPLLRHKPYA